MLHSSKKIVQRDKDKSEKCLTRVSTGKQVSHVHIYSCEPEKILKSALHIQVNRIMTRVLKNS